MRDINEHLVIIALGVDRSDIVSIITELIYSNNCQIESTHIHKCDEAFAVTLLINGNWNCIAKLETSLDSLERKIDCEIIYKRTKNKCNEEPGIPYIVQVIASYRLCILSEISAFFETQNVVIREVAGYHYVAQQTCAEMFNLQMVVELPIDINISGFREQFMLFCDDLNIDATIEPDKI